MNFFALQNPRAGLGDAVTDYLGVGGSRTGDAPRCPACGRFVGMLPLLPPIRVSLEAWGSQWGDVAFGPGDQILISQKLKRLFIESALVGFTRLDPVEVVRVERQMLDAGSPPNYQLASIRRSRAAIDESASGLVRDEPSRCEECRSGGIIKRAERIILEANTWSGEDVFFARGLPGTILVTERFKRLCDDSSLANCSLVGAQDFHFDHYPQELNA